MHTQLSLDNLYFYTLVDLFMLLYVNAFKMNLDKAVGNVP